jgi:hypothetical protein
MDILSQAGPITIEALGQVLTSVGLSATLVLFFVWQAWKREERQASEVKDRTSQMEHREEKLLQRMTTLEEFTRVGLMSLVEKTAAVVADNTTALRDTQQTLAIVRDGLNAVHEDLKEHHKMAQQTSQVLLKKEQG